MRHLLGDLGDAIRAVVDRDRQHVEIRQVAKPIAEETVVPTDSVAVAPSDTAKPTAAQQRSQSAYARRQARYEDCQTE